MSPRVRHPGAADFVPDSRSLAELADAARGCRGCDLYAEATQTVFGRGPRTARLMLVGEQPGDVEDTEGQAFVGPAGRMLNDALEAAGLAGTPTYVTNAVEYFTLSAVTTARWSRQVRAVVGGRRGADGPPCGRASVRTGRHGRATS